MEENAGMYLMWKLGVLSSISSSLTPSTWSNRGWVSTAKSALRVRVSKRVVRVVHRAVGNEREETAKGMTDKQTVNE
jgi:hypothetical protein